MNNHETPTVDQSTPAVVSQKPKSFMMRYLTFGLPLEEAKRIGIKMGIGIALLYVGLAAAIYGMMALIRVLGGPATF